MRWASPPNTGHGAAWGRVSSGPLLVSSLHPPSFAGALTPEDADVDCCALVLRSVAFLITKAWDNTQS